MKELKENISTNEDEQFLYKLIFDDLDIFTKGYKWRFYGCYNAVNFLETIPIEFMSFIVNSTPFETSQDFSKYLKRLNSIPRQIDQQIDLMNEAINKGTTLPR